MAGAQLPALTAAIARALATAAWIVLVAAWPALLGLEARVKYADPAYLAPRPITVVPVEIDRREMQQANPMPAQ